MDPLQLFFTLLLLCFSAAGLSLLIQFEGLYGASGLTPIGLHAPSIGFSPKALPSLDALFRRPTLLPLLAPLLGLSYDEAGRLLAALCFASGLGGALLNLRLRCGHPTASLRWGALLVCWAAYLSLMATLPPPFLNFQWDILLLEVAFGALLFGPSLAPSPIPLLVLRFSAFKLMLMSGAVKLQAACKTWDSLTATQVHFASQPLPAPTSSLLHSMPPLLHSLSVAATLWIELPGALLLLLPDTTHWAVAAQVLLQALILASGNYNFFNLLTVALFMPLLVAPSGAATGSSSPRGCLSRSAQAALFFTLLLASSAAMFSVTLQPPTVAVPLSPASQAASLDGWLATNSSSSSSSSGELLLLTPWWSRIQLTLRPHWKSSGAGLGPALDAIIRLACLLAGGQFLWEAAHSALRHALLAPLLEAIGESPWEVEQRRAEAAAAAAAAAEKEEEETPGCTARQQGAYSHASDLCASALYNLVLTPGRVLRALLGMQAAVLFLAASGAALTTSAVSLGLLRRATLIDPAIRKGYTPAHTAAGLRAAWHSLSVDQGFPPQALALHGAVHPWMLSAGYGLFRSMTGQGPEGVEDAWGAPVATTLRPELVVEGWWPGEEGGRAEWWVAPPSDHATSPPPSPSAKGFWRELPFPYKPGPAARAPAWVAPHSPRLDWQLWFAALGSTASEGYVHHLASLILHGSPAVYSLLLPVQASGLGGPEQLGWPVVALRAEAEAEAEAGGAPTAAHLAVPPKRLRIRRFAMDFVRPAGLPWVRHRHQRLAAFFGLQEEEEQGQGQGWGITLQPLAGLADHPALASLLALSAATPPHTPAALPLNSSAWWQRAPVDESAEGEDGSSSSEEPALYMEEVSSASKSLRDAVAAAGLAAAKQAIPTSAEAAQLASSLQGAQRSAAAAFAFAQRALGLKPGRAAQGSSSSSISLEYLAWALNLQALYQQPLAALTAATGRNPLLQLGKLAVLLAAPVAGFCAQGLLVLLRVLRVEQSPGHVVLAAGSTLTPRLVHVPASAHISSAWPVLTPLLLYCLALACWAAWCPAQQARKRAAA